MKDKLPAIIATLVIAAAAVILVARNYFVLERNNAAAVVKAYQLYTAEEKLVDINLYFGDPDTDGFKAVKTGVFETPLRVNQAKQAVLKLLEGPPQGVLRVIPEGTMLRELYLDANGIVYADFSQELALNLPGGSTSEYLAVYSITNTLFDNFAWIRGLRILVDGKETTTLTGHVSLDGIFRPGEN